MLKTHIRVYQGSKDSVQSRTTASKRRVMLRLRQETCAIISGNLYPNCIIRHMLTKWTDHSAGICRWGVRTALKGLGIRKCVSSGLASYMFTIRCISIIFCCFVIHVLLLDKLGDLLMYLSLSAIRCISAEPLYVCQTVGVWIGK